MAVDPCAALFGAMKTACQNTVGGISAGSGGSGGGTVGGLLGLNGAFDWRHFMVRVAEFGVWLLMIVIAGNALVRESVMGSPVAKSTKQVTKKIVGKK